MKLVVLGSTGYHPNELRHTACLMLPAQGVVLDAGTGMFRRPRLAIDRRWTYFLTHAHLDHIVGLSFLFDVLAGHPFTTVTVHGQPKARSRRTPVQPAAVPGETTLQIPAAGGKFPTPRRRAANAFSARTSRRRGPSGLTARAFAGLCDRHDGSAGRRVSPCHS